MFKSSNDSEGKENVLTRERGYASSLEFVSTHLESLVGQPNFEDEMSLG